MEKKGFRVTQAESVKEGISQAMNSPPAFAVVDLRLNDGNGLEVVKEIQKIKKNSRIVLLTGYGNIPTAVAAVKAGAIDYIEKPIDIEDLQAAVAKVSKSDGDSESNVDFGMIKQLLNEYKAESKSDTIAVPTLSGYEIIKSEDIIHLEADESYTRIFLVDGKKCVSSMTIARYEKVLDPNTFFRVHKSHIINISSIGGIAGSSKFSGLSAYSSSKGALNILTEMLCEEFKDSGPSFNCLALGAVQTEMLEEAFPGYQAQVSSLEMANYIYKFSLEGNKFFNGKIIPVSTSNP